MRIVRVRAGSFGPLAGRDLTFAPGLTVVHGPNESGKSSWHAALYAGLCGLRRGPGRPKDLHDFSARHRPWDGGDWRVVVEVALDDGRCLEIHRDLDGRVDARVIDRTTGRDVASDLIFQGAPDASTLLGLNRRTFLTTVCVRQADVVAVIDGADGLQEQLQRAAATGGRDANAEEAIRRIADYRRDHVGPDRANSTKPLRAAIEAKADAAEALRLARAAHEQHRELVRRRDRADSDAREVEQQLRAVEAAAAHRRFRELQVRVERARQLTQRLDDVAPSDVPDAALARQVDDAIAAYRNRPPQPAPLTGPSHEELAAELAELPEPPDGDLEPAAEVEDTFQEWRESAHRLAHHRQDPPTTATVHDVGGATPSALRQAADDLEAAAAPVDAHLAQQVAALRPRAERPAALPPVALVAAGVLALIGTTLVVGGHAVIGAVALVAAAGVAVTGLARRAGATPVAAQLQQLEARLTLQQEARRQAAARHDHARRACAGWSVAEQPAVLRRLAREIEDASDAETVLRRWQQREASLRSALATAETELRSSLARRGVDGAAEPGRDPEQLIHAYRGACRQRAERQRQASRRTALEAALGARRTAEAAVATARRQRHEAAERILSVAHRARIDAGEPRRALDELERWREQRDQQLAALRQIDVRRATLDELLGGRTLADLERKLHEERCRLPAHDDHTDPDEDLDARLAHLDARARLLRRDADHLAGQVADRERQLPSVAEAEETLAELERELTRIRRLDDDLTRAQRFLEAARDRVHRDIAPVLAGAVTRRLPAITGGRYLDAIVDPATLQVHVRSADGKLRQATLLSHGTTEQIYLLLRLAMAEHLVTTGETSPFILDDALVQTDSTRAAAVLDLLHEISDDRQIIVFSQEDDVLQWARATIRPPHDALVALDPRL